MTGCRATGPRISSCSGMNSTHTSEEQHEERKRMRLHVPIGLAIAVPPLFFWERNSEETLRIAHARSFHPRHATTCMCLQILEETIRESGCEKLLDVGCGSGILTLAAAFMGVEKAIGIDVTLRGIRESIANAELNSLTDKTRWIVGSTGSIRGSFPCVVANLRTEILGQMLKDLVRLTSEEGGKLILSGFHDIDRPHLETRWAAMGMRLEQISMRDQSFFGIPPSGSFTWGAARLCRDI